MYDPKFSITNNLLTYISRIESAKALIDNAPLVPAWESKFRDDAMGRTVHYGTKIEGNDLTQEQSNQIVALDNLVDTQSVSQKAGIIARERDIQEVINYRNVIKWIDEWQQFIHQPSGEVMLSEDILKTLHTLTMTRLIEDKYVGNYRDKQVIVKSAMDESIVFRPPIAAEITYLVEEFFEWLNLPATRTIHPIFRAALTHYQLVYIHPFIEGNGRTARAMATLVLYTGGYDFKRFFSLEKYFDDDVDKYYQALQSVQKSLDQDATYWLEYFCYGLAIETEKIKSQVLKLSKDLKLKESLGMQVALSERQILLLELIQAQGMISSQEAQKILPSVSVDTILRDLKDLIHKGVIEKAGVTKGVTYKIK